jgi:FMN phosphatase YigB (HAD superfamily)
VGSIVAEPNIKLVVFDLGRVLIRLCDDWQHAARVAGVKVPREVSKLDDAARAAFDEIVARYDRGVIDMETFAREVATDRGVEPQDIIGLQRCLLQGPYPGASELIDDLLAAGLKTACLSNTTDIHWQQLHDPNDQNFLPLNRLSYRFASHLIGLCKPSDEIYKHVERTTGLAPQSIIFFDDIDANVTAAAKRGWRAIQIQVDSDPIQQIRVHLAKHGVL